MEKDISLDAINSHKNEADSTSTASGHPEGHDAINNNIDTAPEEENDINTVEENQDDLNRIGPISYNHHKLVCNI